MTAEQQNETGQALTQGVRFDDLSPEHREAIALGDVFARSGYFSDARQQSQAAVKILLGRSLGIGPVESMSQLSMIDGKPSMGATLQASQLRRSGDYDYSIVHLDEQRCELQFVEVDADGEQTPLEPNVEFTIADAQQAQLADKPNWKRYPKAMLFARAMTAGIRLHAPEVLGAAFYDPDELDGANGVAVPVVDVPAEPVADVAPEPAKPRGRKRSSTAKRTSRPKPAEPEQPPADEPEPAEAAVVCGAGGGEWICQLDEGHEGEHVQADGRKFTVTADDAIDGGRVHPALAAEPEPAPETEAEPPAATGPALTADQRRELHETARSVGLTDETAMRALLEFHGGSPHTDRIERARFDDVLAAVKNWKRTLAALAAAATRGEEPQKTIYDRHLGAGDGEAAGDDDEG